MTKKKAKEAAKKANQTKAVAKSVKRKTTQGIDVVLSPVRFLGKGVNGIRVVTNKVKLVLFAAVGIVVAVFLIIILLLNAVLSVAQTETSVAVSTILTSDDSFVADMTEILQQKANGKRQEAENLAKGSPQNPNVLVGHTISKYGYPNGRGNWADGTQIVYVDGSGNVIANGVNNIKYCIVLAYVIMDGDFDSNKAARDDLITDLWELMNPQVTYQESNIYTCPYGCDSFSYNCDVSADYTVMSNYTSHGVGFYGSRHAYSTYGDSYKVTCKGCKDNKNKTFYHPTQYGSGEADEAEGCTNYEVEYTCYGHSITVCYGHKDIEVYLKVLTMDEIFASGILPDGKGKTYKNYLSKFDGWTDDNMEWAKLLAEGNWMELYGVKT